MTTRVHNAMLELSEKKSEKELFLTYQEWSNHLRTYQEKEVFRNFYHNLLLERQAKTPVSV